MSRYRTIDDAVHAWVNEFSRFPTDMIAKLMSVDEGDEWREVTRCRVGDRISGYTIDDGEIIGISDDGICTIRTDGGEIVTGDFNSDFDIERDDILPMWGWMWQFGDMLDDEWLEDEKNVQKMSQCGFRIYHHDEWGYFFGIDGAGFDFYAERWAPLYIARGLHWHE